MKTTAHTPTPWTIDSDGDGKPNAIITSTHDADGPDDDVCEVYGGNSDDDETRAANAALIVRAVNSHAAQVGVAGLGHFQRSHQRGDLLAGRAINREECAKNILACCEKFRAALATLNAPTPLEPASP